MNAGLDAGQCPLSHSSTPSGDDGYGGDVVMCMMAEKDQSCTRLKYAKLRCEERSWDAKVEARMRRSKLGCEARMRSARS